MIFKKKITKNKSPDNSGRVVEEGSIPDKRNRKNVKNPSIRRATHLFRKTRVDAMRHYLDFFFRMEAQACTPCLDLVPLRTAFQILELLFGPCQASVLNVSLFNCFCPTFCFLYFLPAPINLRSTCLSLNSLFPGNLTQDRKKFILPEGVREGQNSGRCGYRQAKTDASPCLT